MPISPESVQQSPSVFKLRHTLRGHESRITRLTWSPNGQLLASSSFDGSIRVWDPETGELYRTLRPTNAKPGYDEWTINGVSVIAWCPAWSPNGKILVSGYDDALIRLWDVETGKLFLTLKGHTYKVNNVAWSPCGKILASSADDSTIKLWNIEDGILINTLTGHRSGINTIAWSEDGKRLASASLDATVRIWDMLTHQTLLTLCGHSDLVTTVNWSPNGDTVRSCSADKTIRIWDAHTGNQKAILEGHTDAVSCISYSFDGNVLASKAIGVDSTVRIWRLDTLESIASLDEPSGRMWFAGLAFHPNCFVLATLSETDKDIRIWDLKASAFLSQKDDRRLQYYCNAKVVLVGESGTGKTCLARSLLGSEFEPQESTHGMNVWNFCTEVDKRDDREEITHEILLWDLAGQVDYQVVHQLFLDKTALGIVLFDPSHPENPFAGVGYWEKALSRVAGEDCPRLLVAGRIDRGHPNVTPTDIKAIQQRHGYQRFIETSAKTNKGIIEMNEAIRQAIPWNRLPVTCSPKLWKLIRDYLLQRRVGDEILTRYSDLCEAFRLKYKEVTFSEAEFDTVIGHAQAQGLLWRLSFGDFVLLKPELLNNYAAAIVRAARGQKDGLGCVAEQEVLQGRIDFEDLMRLTDTETERALLYAVVQLFLQRELALRESGQLVFPSKFNRLRADISTTLQREVAYRFTGPVEEIYATLVVRLFYCGAFTIKELWKNGADLYDSLDYSCGFYLDSSAEGLGEISVFFAKDTPDGSKVLFLRFIQEHLHQMALSGSVNRERIYRCPKCGEEVENHRAIEVRLSKGQKSIPCQFCDEIINLIDILEAKFASPELLRQVRKLEENIVEERNQAVGVTVAEAKEKVDEYDVFLAHNSTDKPQMEAICQILKKRGLSPWLDVEQIPPVAGSRM